VDNVPRLHDAIEKALREALGAEGERVHVFTHVSHVYSSGSSLYTTYVYRLAADPALTLARWKKLKGAASAAIVAHGGTISHQHGVGKDHAPYLAAEKGPLGMSAIANAISHFDPEGLLASGNLVSLRPDGEP
jgi:alkyldihydroxyacetonephosphate synthase